MSRPVESPFLSHELFVESAEAEWESNAAAVAAESPFLHDVDKGRLFEGFVPVVSQDVLKSRIDEYFNRANFEYTIPAHRLPDGTPVAVSTVKARPQFRYARGVSDAEKSNAKKALKRLVGGSLSPRHVEATIRKAVYGRAKPSEIAAMTQALIDKGELDAVRTANPGKSDDFLVRALQRKFKIGIDCAGYVQLAFIFAFTGSDDDPPGLRERLGLDRSRGNEALNKLSAKHFKKVRIVDARTGDLFVLKPEATSRDGAWHTVIIVKRTVAAPIHTFEVDASWGVDLYGLAGGGVARREWQYDTSTRKWWDIAPVDRPRLRCHLGATPVDVTVGDRACENSTGPYSAHRPYGVYRARER